MKMFLAIVSIGILIVVVVCATSYLTERNEFYKWNFKSAQKIAWARFTWANDSFGNKYFERTAMHIPAAIEGLPYNFRFQFDLGAVTVIYEKSLNSVLINHPEFNKRITKFKSILQFWDKNKSFKDLTVTMGDIKINTPDGFVMQNFGDQLVIDQKDFIKPIPIGTIGVDMFQNKVLIIDYPNQKFAVCDSLPEAYNVKFVDIELDKYGKVILPMEIKKNHYRITFDNGSSIFPIITLAENIGKFSTGPDIDTLKISSWGQVHDVTGKMISDTFELAGHTFSNVKVYANHSGLGIDHDDDGVAGNALFWDKTLIIDFKNKKFGLK